MKETAIYALTPKGAELGRFLAARLHGDLFLSRNLVPEGKAVVFDSIINTVRAAFHDYRNHIFITAAGIAVRAISPCIRAKDRDPAVVVLDQRGQYCVSLLSGHLGGANELALRIASLTGGREVITTATDTEGLPSMDMVAMEKGMVISNLDALKAVNGAILRGETLQVFDVRDYLGFRDYPPEEVKLEYCTSECDWVPGRPGIWVDWHTRTPPQGALLLHPGCMVAGVGCNRGTGADEIVRLIRETLSREGISMHSLRALATIDIKKEEAGLLKAAGELGLPLLFFSREQIGTIDVPHPSLTVKRHMGVKSVCEAAALLGAGKGELVIPKTKSRNATMALALEY